ncbi:hypothetical protein [Aminirod propionatiphilus]|uniref:Low molecular weight protein arginine phosphatase n=1 Tax=Aminirod propionatiphilus TaxID=3415223 RepID=A0ACD1DSL0_9BACT|nr:low molecular weight protein arginine phosphatase [Synergistota bacterium]
MERLLFVCGGNTCRSPMAAALADAMLRRRGMDGRWEVASAGVAAFAGDEATPLARSVVARRGLSLEGHRSRPLSAYDVEMARLVLTMTLAQRDALRHLYPEFRERIFLLSEAAGRTLSGQERESEAGGVPSPLLEIEDPFGGDGADYEDAAALLEELIDRLLMTIADP